MSKVKAQSSNFPLTFILSPRSLCRNRRKRYVCHSERSEESRRISVFQPIDSTRFFTSFRMTDIAFPPITTQSREGGVRGIPKSALRIPNYERGGSMGKIRRAIISVTDKSGGATFAKALA